MASLALDSRHAADVQRRDGQNEIGVDQALAAVRRLAGASSVDLIAYDRRTGAITVTGGTTVDAVVPTPALLAVMKAETAFILTESKPRWVEASGDRDEEKLLVKMADRSTTTLFLLIGLADVSAVARARLMRLVPDLMVLIRFHAGLNTRVQDAEELRDAAAEALDHGECGVIAVRADHSIVFANAAALAHLAQEAGLRVRRGVLRPADHANAIRFEVALDSVIDPSRHERTQRPRASVMLLADKDDGRRTIVVIAPAGSASARSDQPRGAAAIVYVLQPSQGAVRGLDTLCQLHGLSRVESRLIAHLIDGLTMTEAAAEMRIKVETARAYLKQIFVKTGMHRQTDLVTLMTRYLRAIRGDFDFRPA